MVWYMDRGKDGFKGCGGKRGMCKYGGYTRVGTEGFGRAGWAGWAVMHGCVGIMGAHPHGEDTCLGTWGLCVVTAPLSPGAVPAGDSGRERRGWAR